MSPNIPFSESKHHYLAETFINDSHVFLLHKKMTSKIISILFSRLLASLFVFYHRLMRFQKAEENLILSGPEINLYMKTVAIGRWEGNIQFYGSNNLEKCWQEKKAKRFKISVGDTWSTFQFIIAQSFFFFHKKMLMAENYVFCFQRFHVNQRGTERTKSSQKAFKRWSTKAEIIKLLFFEFLFSHSMLQVDKPN